MSAKRNNLKPVYLTATEIDLVCEAFDVLHECLCEGGGDTYIEKFAKSHTRRRIIETRALFVEKQTLDLASLRVVKATGERA